MMQQTEKYFLKARNLCKDTVSVAPYPNLIHSLEEFLTQVIDSISDLQNREVGKFNYTQELNVILACILIKLLYFSNISAYKFVLIIV